MSFWQAFISKCSLHFQRHAELDFRDSNNITWLYSGSQVCRFSPLQRDIEGFSSESVPALCWITAPLCLNIHEHREEDRLEM